MATTKRGNFDRGLGRGGHPAHAGKKAMILLLLLRDPSGSQWPRPSAVFKKIVDGAMRIANENGHDLARNHPMRRLRPDRSDLETRQIGEIEAAKHSNGKVNVNLPSRRFENYRDRKNTRLNSSH